MKTRADQDDKYTLDMFALDPDACLFTGGADLVEEIKPAACAPEETPESLMAFAAGLIAPIHVTGDEGGRFERGDPVSGGAEEPVITAGDASPEVGESTYAYRYVMARRAEEIARASKAKVGVAAMSAIDDALDRIKHREVDRLAGKKKSTVSAVGARSNQPKEK